MSTKIYVGNLPFAFNDSALQNLFTPFGNVSSAKLILDRESGRSKGFGFVEMSTEEEAKAAIAKLNGQEVDGRAITVNEARPQAPRSGGFGGGGGGGGRGGFGGGGGGGGGGRGGRNRY